MRFPLVSHSLYIPVHNASENKLGNVKKSCQYLSRWALLPVHGAKFIVSEVITRLFYYKRRPNSDIHRRNLLKEHNGKPIQLISKDKRQLDGMIFEVATRRLNKAVIFVEGARRQYESKGTLEFIHFVRKHVHPDITVLAYNNRGVGKSQGRPSPKKLGKDVKKTFKELMERGYELSDILVYGFSMGGMAAIIGASKLNGRVNIIVDRSFADFSDVAENLIGFGIVGRIVKWFCQFSGWQTPYIPETFTNLQGNKALIYAKADQLIPPKVSLYQSLKKANALQNIQVIRLSSHINGEISHYAGSIAKKIRNIVSASGFHHTISKIKHHSRSFTKQEGKEVARVMRNFLGIGDDSLV